MEYLDFTHILTIPNSLGFRLLQWRIVKRKTSYELRFTHYASRFDSINGFTGKI